MNMQANLNKKRNMHMNDKVKDWNQEQAEYWSGDGGDTWLAQYNLTAQAIRPFSDHLFKEIGFQPGQSVVDIGCGTGETSLEIAKSVGATGKVLGVDISPQLIDTANASAKATGASNASFELADAAAYNFEGTNADIVTSRFGVMFFGDSTAAFANIRKGMAKEGKLAFACWQDASKNAFFSFPIVAASKHVPTPEAPPPETPGPMAFCEPDYTRQVLEGAGFKNIEIESYEHAFLLPKSLGDLDAVTAFLMDLVARRLMLTDFDEATHAKIATDLKALIADYETDKGVELPSAIWVVKADA